MKTKADAINQIHFLMNKYSITVNEISDTYTPEPINSTEIAASTPEKSANNIKKFFAFLGGIFILCGLSIYILQYWAGMNSAARIIITLGVGIAMYIFAIVASYDKRYEKILAPFFILAALFETIGLFVTLYELFPYPSDWHKAALLVFGVILVQQVITFVKYPRSALLFLSLTFGTLFFATLLDYVKLDPNYSEMTLGLSLVLISYGLNDTKHRSITPFWYLIGSALFLFGLFSLIQNTYVEALFLGVSIVVIYLSTIVKSRMLLFTGTVALISYIGYFTNKHFTESLGWPLSLILFGLLLLGISMISIRIGRSIR